MADTLVRLDELLAQMRTLGDSLTDTNNAIEAATKRLGEAVNELSDIAEEIENEIIPRVESAEADNYARSHDDDDDILSVSEEGGE